MVSLEEKRRFPRIEYAYPLRYQIKGKSEFNNTLSDNISLNGVGLVNDGFIAPKTMLALEINVFSRILRPLARVAWSSPLPHSDRYRLGVEFLELDQQEKRFLQDHIDMQMGKF